MFKPEDFEISLERKLKLRVIDDEISTCTDVKVLQETLKQVVAQSAQYQHLLGVILKEQIAKELKDWGNIIEKEINGTSNGS